MTKKPQTLIIKANNRYVLAFLYKLEVQNLNGKRLKIKMGELLNDDIDATDIPETGKIS